MMVDACWVILHALLSSDDVFKIIFFFQKNISGTLSECQTVSVRVIRLRYLYKTIFRSIELSMKLQL